jgi:Ca-activated chloride channel family protein
LLVEQGFFVGSPACLGWFVYFCAMSWFRSFGLWEVMVVVGFAIAYVLYLVRVSRIARTFHSSTMNLVIKVFLRTAILALLIVALLGPSFGDSKREIQSIGKDIMICVDLSKSMDAFDIQPTRLEKIKYEMKRVVDAFYSDRVGIVIFSGEAFMQCPLTFDQNALHLFIETLNTNLVQSGGTDFGPPLRMALNKLIHEDESRNQQKSKVIILISDGEDFGEETDEVAREVEENGIRLFTLGIGTEAGSQINAERGYKTDRSGNTIITKLNASSLKGLASRTNGQYFEINESRNDVSRLINTISRIEGELRDTKTVDVSANRYFYFLLVAFVLLIVDIFANVRTVKI